MGCLTKNVVRVGLIGALVAGAAVAIAGPHRVRAVIHEARSHVNSGIDGMLDDPVALRAQLRDLEAKYPERIAAVQADLDQVTGEIASLHRSLAVSERVVALADEDLDRLEVALGEAQSHEIHRASLDGATRVVIVFKNNRLSPAQAATKAREITNTRNAYAARADDIRRELGYLGQQEERLSSLASKMEAEQAEFQAQLWELDRQVDAIARNERMVKMMEQRERRFSRFASYEGVSLDNLRDDLSRARAEQERRLEALMARVTPHDYEAEAKRDLDRVSIPERTAPRALPGAGTDADVVIDADEDASPVARGS